MVVTEAIVRSTSLPVTKTRLGWNEQTKFIVDVAERLRMYTGFEHPRQDNRCTRGD